MRRGPAYPFDCQNVVSATDRQYTSSECAEINRSMAWFSTLTTSFLGTIRRKDEVDILRGGVRYTNPSSPIQA